MISKVGNVNFGALTGSKEVVGRLLNINECYQDRGRYIDVSKFVNAAQEAENNSKYDIFIQSDRSMHLVDKATDKFVHTCDIPKNATSLKRIVDALEFANYMGEDEAFANNTIHKGSEGLDCLRSDAHQIIKNIPRTNKQVDVYVPRNNGSGHVVTV